MRKASSASQISVAVMRALAHPARLDQLRLHERLTAAECARMVKRGRISSDGVQVSGGEHPREPGGSSQLLRWLTRGGDGQSLRSNRDGRLLGVHYLLAAGYILAISPELHPYTGIELLVGAGLAALFGVASLILPWDRLPAEAIAWCTAAGFATVTLSQAWLGELHNFGPPFSLGFAFSGLVLGSVRTRQILALSLGCLILMLALGRQHDHIAQAVGIVMVSGMMGELVAAGTASRRRQTDDVRRLQEGLADLLGVRDQEQAAALITALAAELLLADGVTVLTYDRDGVLVVRGGHGAGNDLTRLRVDSPPDQQSGLHQVVTTGGRLFIAEVPGDDRVAPEYTRAYSIASLLYLPLIGQDALIGVVAIWWHQPHSTIDAFGDQVIQLLSLQAGTVMDRVRQLDELDQAATTDQLTGVGNRRAYEQRLAKLPEDAAVILCDLDRFKHLNDTQGHPAGDRVLRAFAAQAASCVRAQTDLVARIGGDEFALIVGNGEATARNVLARLRASWNDPEGVGFSAGIAARAIGEDAYELAERADQALYAEKRQRHRERKP